MLQRLARSQTFCLLALFAAVASASAEDAALAPRSFATPEEAARALVDAARTGDVSGLKALFGSSGEDIVESGDPVQDANDREAFVQLVDKRLRVDRVGEDKAILDLGEDDWPFPVPLIRQPGGWVFDAKLGREEILDRRIGRNELGAIKVLEAYVQAQAEYASADRDGDRVPEYAQKLASEPGRYDGLFWETAEGEPPSPLGPLVADARAEGYHRDDAAKPIPYHGYYFRILKSQGRDAPGGAYSYMINGNMLVGFGLLAFPADYGASGVMSFIVNQSGEIYEKDLGPNTEEIAGRMTEYDPGVGWESVNQSR
jgi:hypothetical protein